MKELTEADKAMIKALAEVVVNDRLARAMEVGATKKGRMIVEFTGQATEAELAWERLKEELNAAQ